MAGNIRVAGLKNYYQSLHPGLVLFVHTGFLCDFYPYGFFWSIFCSNLILHTTCFGSVNRTHQIDEQKPCIWRSYRAPTRSFYSVKVGPWPSVPIQIHILLVPNGKKRPIGRQATASTSLGSPAKPARLFFSTDWD